MRFLFQVLSLGSVLLPVSLASQAQQTPVPSSSATSTSALSEDSVRVMSGLVQASVRQLRAIYFEADDTRATQLVEAALLQIPAYNQRLSAYTASLPREQQQLLAQRLRQQPWQVELQTLLRSPQYKTFNVRTARSPTLKVAADRLAATGFLGSAKPTPAAPLPTDAKAAVITPATKSTVKTASPAVGAAASPAASAAAGPTVAAAPGVAATAAPAKSAALVATPVAAAKPAEAKAVRRHTVVKGETLFAIARRYSVKPDQLQRLNGKADKTVKIGEVLTIPAAD